MQILFLVLLTVTALFLILIILVQKGKGGGLAGAFGGMGGQSAFGAKAGDLFTRVTIGVAAFWIILCLCSVAFLRTGGRMTGAGGGGGAAQPGQEAPANPGSPSAPGTQTPVPAERGAP
jgi:preprotein translocase subunit SecG